MFVFQLALTLMCFLSIPVWKKVKEQKAIEEQEKYMQTKKYVEEVAKDKLGLVYPKEKVFKEKEEN